MSETHVSRLPSPRELKALIEAERTGEPFVYWRDAADQQRILLLSAAQGRVTIGRSEQSNIAITSDPEVSRTHAILELVGDEWTLLDDGLSRNGSFVNGSRIARRHRLDDKDRIWFGNTLVIYREPASDQGSVSTARAAGSPGAISLSEAQRRVLIALCRPVFESTSATAATNPQIAAEVHLSIDAVKAQLRILFERFGLGELPQNEKRTRLALTVLGSGLLAPHDF